MNQFTYTPRVLALTGNVASGKSTVARILRDRGAYIVDADELARDAVAPGTPGLDAIRQRWGDKVLHKDGSLNRKALADIVFRNDAERLELNAIVHPAVERLRRMAIARGSQERPSCVVCDIPLLFETGLDAHFDFVVLVDAPEEVRRERLRRLRGMSKEDADALIAAQEPSDGKRERSDFVLRNGSTLEELTAQIDVLWQLLTGPVWPPRSGDTELPDVLPSDVDVP